MVKRFCDLCEREISTGGWYDLNVDYRTDISVHPKWLVMKDICDECYSAIYETIANIKYGNNDENVIDEE